MAHQPNVTIHTHSDGNVVQPVGDFDLDNVDLIRGALQKSLTTSNCLVLDLSETSFLDSVVLSAVIGAYRSASRSDGWIRLAAPLPHVRKVLSVTRLDEVIAVFDSVADAVVGIGAASAARGRRSVDG